MPNTKTMRKTIMALNRPSVCPGAVMKNGRWSVAAGVQHGRVLVHGYPLMLELEIGNILDSIQPCSSATPGCAVGGAAFGAQSVTELLGPGPIGLAHVVRESRRWPASTDAAVYRRGDQRPRSGLPRHRHDRILCRDLEMPVCRASVTSRQLRSAPDCDWRLGRNRACHGGLATRPERCTQRRSHCDCHPCCLLAHPARAVLRGASLPSSRAFRTCS